MKKSFYPIIIVLIIAVLSLLSCPTTAVKEEEEDEKPAITVIPDNADLLPAAQYLFRASVTVLSNKNVTWSIAEGSPAGGTIDPITGLYTAPLTEGYYHVVAVSNEDAALQDTAVVHVFGGATGIPYYIGTIDVKIQDTYTTPSGTSMYDDQESFTVMLDLDDTFNSGFPDDTRWVNWRNGHNVVNVSYYINERFSVPNASDHTRTSMGWHTTTPSSFQVNLIIWKSLDKYELIIPALLCPNIIDSWASVPINWFLNAVDVEVSPLPLSLTNLSGTYEDIYPGSQAKRVTTWDLKRTF